MSAKELSDKLGLLNLDSPHKIIVGVDYGTTFTGACYVTATAKDPSDITLISTWPGPTRDSETVLKTPSRIAYSTDNPRVGSHRWGYQVEPGMTAYSWTKLLLDKGIRLTEFDDSALEDETRSGMLRLPDGKTAVDVVSDYLSKVYQHILASIAKRITDESLRITPLEFWFTIPAIWSDQAQHATRTAAQRAGFGSTVDRPNDKFFMISEPEAAAVMAIKKYTTNGIGGFIKPGDGVLVCDCGGGTVDITTYRVNKTSPLTFEELCTGNGGKCGSTAVDRNFYKLMSNRFGDAFDNLPMKRKGPRSDFMKKFEIIKRDFGYPSAQTTFELPLRMQVSDPNPKFFDEEEHAVIIYEEDLRSIFDPVVGQIMRLVGEQIRDANDAAGKDIINRIILVGGFGDSEYLRKAFREQFGSTGKIAITVPDDPQTAIVQGAALRGLEGLRSTTRRCRRHYGFEYSIPFRFGIDQFGNSYVNHYTGKLMACGIMKWVVAKGRKYSENYTHAEELCHYYYTTDNLRRTVRLYSCDLDDVPARAEDPGVNLVGEILVDFTKEDLSIFDSKCILGKPAYCLKFDLATIFGGEEGGLKVEARCGERVIGNTSINFNTRGLLQ